MFKGHGAKRSGAASSAPLALIRPRSCHWVLIVTRVVQERRLASLLVFSWRRNEKISAGSVKSGFEAIYRSLGDIAIDVPDAVRHLQDFVGRAQHDGLLPQDWLEGLAR